MKALLQVRLLIAALALYFSISMAQEDNVGPMLTVGMEYAIEEERDDGLSQDELQLVEYSSKRFLVLKHLGTRRYQIAYIYRLWSEELAPSMVITGTFRDKRSKEGWRLSEVDKAQHEIHERMVKERKEVAMRKGITVFGQVGRPGVVTIPEGHRIALREAVLAAGDLKGIADTKRIKIRRRSSPETIEHVNLKDREAKPVYLERGDLVVVQARLFD